MELIIKLIWGAIEGVIWGVLLLVVEVLLLPEKLFFKILKKLKPDITSRSAILSKLRLIFDYLFNNKEVIFEDVSSGASRRLQEEVAELMKEKRTLEGNLFFLDLLKNLTSMLLFSVSHAGYGDSSVCEILDQSMEYLQYYARQLKGSSSAINIEERVSLAAQRLRDQVIDTAQFLQKEKGEQQLEIARFTLKQGTAAFDSFMRDEYESTKESLRRINQLLSDKFMVFVGESE